MKKIIALLLFVSTVAFGQNYPSPTYKTLTLQNPLTIPNGGTGAATQSAALTALLGSSVIPVANGGTNASTASGTALDNITGFAGTGFLTRTGAGAYTFQSTTNGVTYANLVQETANTVLCNATGSLANTTACVGFQLADPAASAFTTTAIYDSSRTSLNGFPLNGEFGGGAVGLVQGLVGAIQAPSTSTAVGLNGVAGYARTASNISNAVGIYGQGTMNPSTGIGNAWGGNTLVTNCPNQSCSATQGVSGNEYGLEIDVNLVTLSGGTAPSGNAKGLYINGIMNTAPTGDFSAINIDHAGTNAWGNGLKFTTGCCTAGVVNSPLATGASQPSIPNIYQSTTAGSVTEQGSQLLDAFGNMQITPGAGGVVSLNNNASVSQLKVGGTNIVATVPIQPTTTGGIIGTTLADNANAGSDGEFLSNTTTGTSMSSGVTANCTSVNLTAGDWDVSGTVFFNPAAGTTVSTLIVGTSTTSATLAGLGTLNQINSAFGTGVGERLSTPVSRFNVSTGTTVFLVEQAVFGVSTMTCDGFIRARRVR